jgi:hypothetical protein
MRSDSVRWQEFQGHAGSAISNDRPSTTCSPLDLHSYRPGLARRESNCSPGLCRFPASAVGGPHETNLPRQSARGWAGTTSRLLAPDRVRKGPGRGDVLLARYADDGGDRFQPVNHGDGMPMPTAPNVVKAVVERYRDRELSWVGQPPLRQIGIITREAAAISIAHPLLLAQPGGALLERIRAGSFR